MSEEAWENLLNLNSSSTAGRDVKSLRELAKFHPDLPALFRRAADAVEFYEEACNSGDPADERIDGLAIALRELIDAAVSFDIATGEMPSTVTKETARAELRKAIRNGNEVLND